MSHLGRAYALRQQSVQQYIRHRKWDALWIVSPANRRYLTGFTGSAGWVLLWPEGKPVLITDGRYTEQSKSECHNTVVKISPHDPHDCLAGLIEKRHIRRMGFEDEHVTVQSWKKINPLVKGIPASGCVEAARVRKSREERACIQQAIAITESAYRSILPKMKPGKREKEIAIVLENAMLSKGGDDLAFPTIIASGPNGALPHAKPSSRVLKSGDLVVMDFGCTWQGYHADLTRTVCIQKSTKKQEKIYEIVKKAQKESAKYIFSGEKTSTSDIKAREIFRKSNVEQYYTHSLGHGLGLEIHEAPKLSKKSRIILDENMIVTCEPGIYIPGWGGIRIEDDILVGKEAPQWLSQSPETLLVLGK